MINSPLQHTAKTLKPMVRIIDEKKVVMDMSTESVCEVTSELIVPCMKKTWGICALHSGLM